jgi:hypothetical protein
VSIGGCPELISQKNAQIASPDLNIIKKGKLMEQQKRVDDMPLHAIAVMKATLDMMGDVFPRIPRKDLADTFVQCYFNDEIGDV